MLLCDAELITEVRLFELVGETISDSAAATIADAWKSVATPELVKLAQGNTSGIDLAELESECRLEQMLMLASSAFSDRGKAQYTREFEAVYAWIDSKRDTGIEDLTESAAFFGFARDFRPWLGSKQ